MARWSFERRWGRRKAEATSKHFTQPPSHLIPKQATKCVVGTGTPGMAIAAFARAIVVALRAKFAQLRMPEPVLVLLRKVAAAGRTLAHGGVHKGVFVRLVRVNTLRAAGAVFAHLYVTEQLAVQALAVVFFALGRILAHRRVPEGALVLG